ncbi:MAG: alginate lyase [Caulobacteraceae bacterium]|nr:alginate lyase [Caulobacteraceae bacterium]
MRSLVSILAFGALLAASPAIAQTPVSAPVCDGSSGYAEAFGGRRTFLWRPDWLMSVKARYATDPTLQPARAAMLARADAALTRGPYTVVDKTQTPASGDKHDYMSMGPYWWPDPSKPDGKPYMRRDGHMNPERDTNAFDLTDLEAMTGDVQALSLAWYFTGDERYAARAAEFLRVWFLAPETKMNPNLNHGQAVPGLVSGRAEGVIDAYRLVRVVEGLGLLDTSSSLTDAERAGLRDWFADLVHWMATSQIGRAEKAATNNHGVYYDLLISEFALYAGMDDVAKTVIGRVGAQRLTPQIAADGSLPQELARTRSLHYSTWTLTAAFDIAQLGQCVGVDLWDFHTGDGRSLRGAANFVAGWAGREGEWPYPELDKTETSGLYEVLQRGAWAWSDPALAARAALYQARNAELDLNLRVPPYAP